MIKYLFLIFIIATTPVFASCPIDMDAGACVAEFQPTLQEIIPPESKLSPPVKPKEFTGITNSTSPENEIEPTKNLRDFGPTGNNYGYNSSCQFGICSNTGTPKNFSVNQN